MYNKVKVDLKEGNSKELLKDLVSLLDAKKAGYRTFTRVAERGKSVGFRIGTKVVDASAVGNESFTDAIMATVKSEYAAYRQGKESDPVRSTLLYFLLNEVVAVSSKGLDSNKRTTVANFDKTVKYIARRIGAVAIGKNAAKNKFATEAKTAMASLEITTSFESIRDPEAAADLAREKIIQEIDQYNDTNAPELWGYTREQLTSRDLFLQAVGPGPKGKNVVVKIIDSSNPNNVYVVTQRVILEAVYNQPNVSPRFFKGSTKGFESYDPVVFSAFEDVVVDSSMQIDREFEAVAEYFNKNSEGFVSGHRTVDIEHLNALGTQSLQDFVNAISSIRKEATSSSLYGQLTAIEATINRIIKIMNKLDSVFLSPANEIDISPQELVQFLIRNDVDQASFNFIQKTSGIKVTKGALTKEIEYSLGPGHFNRHVKGAATQRMLKGVSLAINKILKENLTEGLTDDQIEKLFLTKGSDSIFRAFMKLITGQNINKGRTKKDSIKINVSFPKVKKGKKSRAGKTSLPKSNAASTRLPNVPSKAPQTGGGQLNVLSIINSEIYEEVKSRMVRPALQYRSGRFARSVKATSVDNDRILYTYLQKPYRLFEDGQSSLASTNRDPRKIIAQSIQAIIARRGLGFYRLVRE